MVEALENDKLPYIGAAPRRPSAQAEAGQVPLLMPTAQSYRVAAVTKLEKYPGKFLYVARGVEPDGDRATCSSPRRTSTSSTGCARRAAA